MLNNNIIADYRNETISLYNRDCLEVLNDIPNNSIDLFCSDIPYRISHKGNNKKKNGKKYMGGMFNSYSNTEENIKNIKKGKIFTHNDIKITAYIGEVYRVLKERNTRIYI